MKILVIGANGFIGSHCVDYFQSREWEVFKADISPCFDSNFYKIESSNSDFSHPFKDHKFDVCINASGSAHVGFSFDNPTLDFELNVVNVQKIMIAIRDFNRDCKFINFSSAAVYGNPDILPITENSICKPLSPYGFHKLQSELLITEYHNFFGLHTCCIRVFSAYGPGLRKQLFWDLYQKTKQDFPITLFGSGNETRDFIYVDDLMQIIDLIIDNSPFQGSVYNAASNAEITIGDAAKIFLREFSLDNQLVFNGQIKVGDPKNWLASIEKLENFGFKPQYNLELGLKKYAEWLKIGE